MTKTETYRPNEENKQDITNLAYFAFTLPPSDSKLNPEDYIKVDLHYFLVGLYLYAFANDLSDPIPNLNINKAIKNLVEYEGNYYLNLCIVIFQAERFIRQEAKKQGINYKFNTRSELVNRIMYERCNDYLRLFQDKDRELPHARELQDLARDCSNFLQKAIVGDFSNEEASKLLEKWKEKFKPRLNDYILESLDQFSWSQFCGEVFYEYRKDIAGFEGYCMAQAKINFLYNNKNSPNKPYVRRCIIANGQAHFPKSRGVGRKAKKS